MEPFENEKKEKYELVPPDGGYGYIIIIAGMFMLAFSIVPVSCFALIYGPYLSQFYDETSSVTIVTTVFYTLFNLTGLLANYLLQKYSFRKVGLLGAILYFFGSFFSIFVTDLVTLTISYGVFQGIGAGLLLPSAITSLFSYFERKKALAVSIGQTSLAVTNILYPGFTKVLMENYGFRGTQIIFTGMSMHIILGAALLQPVKWHLKKKKIQEQETTNETAEFFTSSNNYKTKKESLSEVEAQKLLESQIGNNNCPINNSKLSQSVTSLPINAPNSRNSGGNFLHLYLLKDFYYWTLVIGIAISSASEVNFMAILPVTFFKYGLNTDEITFLMTIFFAADLVTRLLLSIVTAFFIFKMQTLFLINALVTIILRIVFTMENSFLSLAVITALLGCSRCIIQLPIPVIITENYPNNFTAAFSFYMVFNGVISTIVGALIGFIKNETGSHIFVLHFLTSLFTVCVIPWICQIFHSYWKSKEKDSNIIY